MEYSFPSRNFFGEDEIISFCDFSKIENGSGRVGSARPVFAATKIGSGRVGSGRADPTRFHFEEKRVGSAQPDPTDPF